MTLPTLTVGEVAAILGRSACQVCVLARSGHLRAQRPRSGSGRGQWEWKISWEALLDYLEPLPHLPRVPGPVLVEDGLEAAWTRVRSDAAIKRLLPRERWVIKEHVVEGSTLDDLVAEARCSRQRISFVAKNGVRRLARVLETRRAA